MVYPTEPWTWDYVQSLLSSLYTLLLSPELHVIVAVVAFEKQVSTSVAALSLWTFLILNSLPSVPSTASEALEGVLTCFLHNAMKYISWAVCGSNESGSIARSLSKSVTTGGNHMLFKASHQWVEVSDHDYNLSKKVLLNWDPLNWDREDRWRFTLRGNPLGSRNCVMDPLWTARLSEISQWSRWIIWTWSYLVHLQSKPDTIELQNPHAYVDSVNETMNKYQVTWPIGEVPACRIRDRNQWIWRHRYVQM